MPDRCPPRLLLDGPRVDLRDRERDSHTELNVIGSRLWPTYAIKSVGLFALVVAVIGGLGGLVQINPVWLYGPFEPSAVT